ncbi:unnamed protein product [Ostreobium quekettii]|uniref:Uncharacterized protein n=1 Tax=Ostreobium quekettii TaxID=121088 RepID=A0A8S1IUU8_9CHLO|nr:unnamed protein product [Ostreobium quekettii]
MGNAEECADCGGVALEVQEPWCKLLLSGAKTIETRRYPLPDDLLGRPLSLLQTPEGAPGQSGLPDIVPQGHPSAQLVAHIAFSEVKEYRSLQEWKADEKLHQLEGRRV